MAKKFIIVGSSIAAITASILITRRFNSSSSEKIKRNLFSIIQDANQRQIKLEFSKHTNICGIVTKVVATYPPDRRADAVITLDQAEKIIKCLKKRGIYVVGKDDDIIFISTN